MRILITTAIYPPDIGGPASYVPKIAQALAARGHEVTVATMADGAGSSTESFGRLVRIERRHTVMRRKLAASWRLLPLVRAADLVYANGLFEELKPIRRLAHRPTVAKIVGDWAWERLRNQNRYRADVDRFQTDRLRSPYARMVRHARGRALIGYDRIIVPSAYLSTMVAGWHPALPPVVVIHNGIDLPDGMAVAAPQPTWSPAAGDGLPAGRMEACR
ncbi:glycosyltransferase [Tistrella bauzanensis]